MPSRRRTPHLESRLLPDYLCTPTLGEAPCGACRQLGSSFTGATSGMRGRAGAIGFSSAKFAARGLAWSLARELWPLTIHAARVIIDGIIATPDVRNAGMVAEGEPIVGC